MVTNTIHEPQEGASVGVFSVPIKVRRWVYRNAPDASPESSQPEIVCRAMVDTGAAHLSLPADLLEQLRLDHLRTVTARTADGARHEYRLLGMAEVEVQGRTAEVVVLELPRGAQPLLGALPLEIMDWHLAPGQQRLVPSPDSPDKPAAWLV